MNVKVTIGDNVLIGPHCSLAAGIQYASLQSFRRTFTLMEDRYEVDLNEGEPEEYHVTMPQQYHMKWRTPRKQKHRIVVEYKIEKIN